MEIFLKCAGAAIFSAIVCVLIKKHSPELSLLLSIVVSVLLLSACAGVINELKALLNFALDILGSSSPLVSPMLKCMGLGLVTKLSSEICKEAAQPAAAAALEYAGILCATAVAMPVISSLLKMIGAII